MPKPAESQRRSDNLAVVMGCLVVAAVGGCSSEGNILPKRERFTPAIIDAGGEPKPPRDPEANCVKPGTPSNERGVGGYCEGPEDCAYDGGPRFCTAEFKELTNVPDDQWYCSTVCTKDEECGTGALCISNAFSTACQAILCIRDAAAPPAYGAGR